ncbi:MAG: hypothetical protein ACLUE8_06125 [Lachnospiraceae bacterium]
MKLRLKIHPAGAVLAALGLMLFPSAGMLAAAAVMLLHEGGHVLAMALCRVKECRIELTPFGGVADVPGFERLPGRQQCLIALAGVPVSAASAWLCLRFDTADGVFSACFTASSLGMALVNVLPVWPLDGARVLLCAARHFGREETVRRAMLWLSYCWRRECWRWGLPGLSGPGEPVAVPAAAVSGLRWHGRAAWAEVSVRGCGTGRRVLAQRRNCCGRCPLSAGERRKSWNCFVCCAPFPRGARRFFTSLTGKPAG